MSIYKETTGFIIHQRNFKNSSLIIEFFSSDFGMIHVIAKGIKSNKKLNSQIQYFCLIKIQFYGKSSLKTLTAIDILNVITYENILNKTAGLYLNELLHYSLIEYEKVVPLFLRYQECLSKFGKGKITPILRNFEIELLKHNGFEISVNHNIDDDSWISINELSGIYVTLKDSEKLCLFRDLKLLLANKKLNFQIQKRINKFMVKAVDISVGNKRLYSRELLILLTSRNSN